MEELKGQILIKDKLSSLPTVSGMQKSNFVACLAYENYNVRLKPNSATDWCFLATALLFSFLFQKLHLSSFCLLDMVCSMLFCSSLVFEKER